MEDLRKNKKNVYHVRTRDGGRCEKRCMLGLSDEIRDTELNLNFS